MSRPLLFLDVDGVLNPVPADLSLHRSLGQHEGYSIHMDPRVPAYVAALVEAFDIVWATAWRDSAHVFYRQHLKLPSKPWPFLDYGGCKLVEIRRYAGEQRWAWIDDEVNWEYKRLGQDWRNLPNSLVISPIPSIGLTSSHVERLLAFARDE